MIKKLCKSLIAVFMAIALTIVGPGIAQATPNTVTYIEGSPPIQINSGLNFSGGLKYADGELRFSLSNGTPNDQLNLTSTSNPTAKGEISVDNSGSIFLGNGSGTNRIGSVLETEDGTNGKDLTIRFSSPLTNAGFETGDLTGWTAFQQNYSTVQNLNGQSIAYDFTKSGGSTGTGNIIVSTPSRASYTVSINNKTVRSGNYTLRLVSNGNITDPRGSNRPSGNGSLHGPYVRSDSFEAFKDDSITLDFSAQQGSDAYEVFGFLIEAGSDKILGTGDDNRTQLFAKRGDTVPFNSVSAIIPADGQYQFEFVCGTYDKTGGLALGASLFVDNVRLVSATSVTDAVIQAISDRVTYNNISNNPNADTRHLNITRKTANNIKDSTPVDILFTAVNDAPTIITNDGATVNEGESVTIGVANLKATDPDDDDADLVYTLNAKPSHGSIQVSGVNATQFTQADLNAGLVTYVHDGSETIADSFSFTLADGGEDGVTPIAGTFNLNVIPQNDIPVVVNPIEDQMIYSRRPWNFPIPSNTFEDADGDALGLTASLANGEPLPTWLSFDSATGIFSGTPSNAEVGTLKLVVTADDSYGGKVNTGFVLNIERGNYPPVVVNPVSDQSAVVTQPLNFTVPATTFSDEDNDPLSLSASLANGASLPTWLSFDQVTGTFSGTPPKTDIGTLCLVVTADDGQGGKVSDRFSLNVESLLSLKETYTNPDNGHIYFLTKLATWTDAQAEAQEVDGNLVTINDEAEHDWLWGIFGTAEPFWIGLNDVNDEGTFSWISGQDFDYEYWHPIKPDSGYYGGEDEDYVVMNWRDFSNPADGWADVENDGPYYGDPVQGIVEVEPESLDYSLNGDSDSAACDEV
ncbi:MAG: hypothetical protein F6K18_29140 [Okeania sp. SIO2C2]|uniref:putative Ig domain-containing protein n=1 Tax=Okeania sp. SIO2C2 TaxID=2607787 RepID=UPI0013BB0320|nr:putative Ig domain-containing protein [Okeania sp. SIO2C2]NEP90556.1 hypothetical protein [Okeania sp. SIO2C2]